MLLLEAMPRIRRAVRLRRTRGDVVSTSGMLATGAGAAGAVALGAIAIGALALGALAIGRLAIGRARVRRLEIDELVVHKLRVTDELEAPGIISAGRDEAV